MRRFADLIFALVFALIFVGCATMAKAAHARDTTPTRSALDQVVLPPNTFTVISYHEVREDVRDYPDPFAVDVSALAAQFSWLRGNGYVPVSLEQILAARRGGKVLPAKAVLLTFDDGYLSFYTHVYPLLREFQFPAVLAIVGKWIDNPPGTLVPYGEKSSVADATFPSWRQLREMADSGLIEMASHSYDLHHGVIASPQGNLQPAATARIYDAATNTYEGDASWQARVRDDLARNVRAIERGTGRKPRVMVWPYGSYNDDLVRIAGELGMPVALTLDDGPNTPDVSLSALRRILIEHNPPLADFISELRGPQFADPIRVVQLSLDTVYDADPVAQENKLSRLLDRIKLLSPTHVILEATADTNGDGIADAAYFPTQYLPLRADLFNRVAWQLASRDDVKVFATLPVTGQRLSGDEIAGLYRDLARRANFDGLLFMLDNGTQDVAAWMSTTQRLADLSRRWRGPMKIARGFSTSRAAPVNDLAALSADSDYVVVAIPPGRSVFNPRTALSVAPGAASSKLVFMLSPQDTALNTNSSEPMTQQMRALQLGEYLNFGYSGDDAARNLPPLEQISPVMSLRIHPR